MNKYISIDEKRAMNVIKTIKSLRGESGVDIYVDLANLHKDLISVTICRYDKEILNSKINMMNISEKVRDDLMYVSVRSLF